MPRIFRKNRDPFEIQLSPEKENELAQRLAREIQWAIDARDRVVGVNGDIESWHLLYSQSSRKLTRDTPWPGAANLTSWIPIEKVDALRARIVSTIFTEPIWIVEGWGNAAQRAPFVEEYHQWTAEKERLQSYISKAIHYSLIEGTGVLEVSERSIPRKVRTIEKVRLATDPETGLIILGDRGPLPLEQNGRLVPPMSDEEPSMSISVDKIVMARKGASYRVLSLIDFFVLPGHASDRADVWGYARRLWPPLYELKIRQEQGIYKNVDLLNDAPEREPTALDAEKGQDIEQAVGQYAPKEIFEITFLDDLDEDGYYEWYVATLHKEKRVLLRLQYDNMKSSRFHLFTPYPREDSVYGYSLIGHKLATITDEHTAWRNMVADRTALVTAAPVKRVIGSPWEPDLMPFGPRQVLDVRDPNDVTAFQMPDVPSSAINMLQMVLGAAERITGQNDATLGVQPQQDRTLGEFQSVLQQSFIRIDEAIKNVQETMEDLFQTRHQILKMTLEEEPEELPKELIDSVDSRGFIVPGGTATAALLEGNFRGKPRGSVENADLNKMRADFVQLMTALTQLSQVLPGLAQTLNTPQAVRSILMQVVRVFRWYDRQALLGAVQQPQFGFARQEPMLPGQLPDQSGFGIEQALSAFGQPEVPEY